LHLELLEIKKKLKPGLPTQVIVKRKIPSDKPQAVAASDGNKSERSDKSSKSVRLAPAPKEEDDELLRLLGQDSPPDSDKKDREPERSRDKDESRDDRDNHDRDRSSRSERDKSERDRDRERERTRDRNDTPPPSKSNDDEVVIPDEVFAQIQEEEDPILKEKRDKAELLWDMKMIAKKYPGRDVPVFTEHDDINAIRVARERTLKEISLDNNVNSYKKYMTAGFLGIELFCISYLNIPEMKGYFMEQTKNMETYESLLIELGEKSGDGWGAGWPVEVRLVLLVIFNAGMFWLGKIIEKNGGSAMTSVFKMFNPRAQESSPPAPSANVHATQSEPPRRMRGPSVRL
jgi:hypothetical protein